MHLYGHNVPELIVNAAHALSFIEFAELDVRPNVERLVKLESVDDDTLLIDWLNELIYLLDADHLIFGRFEVVCHTPGSAEIRCHGELLDPARHRLVREVKAATYYGAHIRTDDYGYTATVIFDV